MDCSLVSADEKPTACDRQAQRLAINRLCQRHLARLHVEHADFVRAANNHIVARHDERGNWFVRTRRSPDRLGEDGQCGFLTLGNRDFLLLPQVGSINRCDLFRHRIDDRFRRDRHPQRVCARTESLFARLHIEGVAGVEEMRFGGCDACPAGLAERLEMKVEQLAGGPAERRRHRASRRHQQLLTGHDQVALRRDAAVGVGGRVRLRHEYSASRLVTPDDPARQRVHRIDENPFRRPNAGGPIHRAVRDHRPAARGPARDQPPVAQNHAVTRPASKLPQQSSVLRAQAIEPPVIADDKRTVAPDRGRETHRPARQERPAFPARGGIEGMHLAIRGTAEQKRVSNDDRVESPVKRHPRVAPRPCRHWRMTRLVAPTWREVAGQILRRVSAAHGIAAERRPIGCDAGARGCDEECDCDDPTEVPLSGGFHRLKLSNRAGGNHALREFSFSHAA